MNKKGFTLIELLAIITLVGIIALIAIPNITKEVQQNEEQKQTLNDKKIEYASRMFVAKYHADDVIDGNEINFKLQDLEDDGLLTISDECVGDKGKTISVHGTNYDYSNLSSTCYSLISVGKTSVDKTSVGKVGVNTKYTYDQLKDSLSNIKPNIYVAKKDNNKLTLYVETLEFKNVRGAQIYNRVYNVLKTALNKDYELKSASCGDFMKYSELNEFLIFVKGSNGTEAFECKNSKKIQFYPTQQNYSGHVFIAIGTSESSFTNIIK